MALGVAAAVALDAVVFGLDDVDDHRTGGPGARVVSVAVGNDQAGTLAFAPTDVLWLHDAPTPGAVIRRSQHDHAVAE
jgi:hypothetical protein